MRSSKETSTNAIDCATCQAYLEEYVDLELSGQTADVRLPAIAFHIETCPACEAAYYREFHAQGLRKPLPELQQTGHRQWVAGLVDKIVSAPAVGQSQPAPNWIEQGLAQGRAWIEPFTQRLRQIQFDLGQLLMGTTLQPAPTLTGLMGEGAATSVIEKKTGRFASAEANFELEVVVTSQLATTGERRCRLEAAVTLYDRFGDYSGVTVTLLWGDQARTGVTDDLGKITFDDLPCAALPSMKLMVRLPD